MAYDELIPRHPLAGAPVEVDGHLCPQCGGIPRRESRSPLGLVVMRHCDLCAGRGMISTDELAAYQARLNREMTERIDR